MHSRSSFGALALLIILCTVEAYARSGAINPVLLPAPSLVSARFLDAAFLLETAGEAGRTLLRALIGLALASLLAIPTGLAMGTHTGMRATLTPLVELLRPIPSSAMIPVAILLLGLGAQMIIFVIWFGTLWPLLINSMYGAKSVTARHREIAWMLKLTRRQVFSLIVLPSAVPHIVAGARVAIPIALILAVTAEMLAGQDGIGFRILDYERAFRYTDMYATLTVIALVGLALNLSFVSIQSRLERRFPSLS